MNSDTHTRRTRAVQTAPGSSPRHTHAGGRCTAPWMHRATDRAPDVLIARVPRPYPAIASRALGRRLAALVAAHRLTPPQAACVAFALCRPQRGARMARELGISPNTLKSRVRELLFATGDASLDALVIRLMRETLGLAGVLATTSERPATGGGRRAR